MLLSSAAVVTDTGGVLRRLPDIASETGGGVAASSWLVTSYVVAMATLGPFAGRLGDRIGRRRVLLWGLFAFAAASAAAGLAPSLELLIAARLGQAIAGSLVFPNAMALMRDALPDGRRAAGFGLLGSAIGAAAAVGPALGGVLVVLAERPGWSAADAGVALAMLPVAMIAVAPFGGHLADRRGHRLPAAGGLALLTVAGATLAAMGAEPSAAGLGAALLLGGVGLGLANAALQTAAIEAVEPRHAGVASGLFSSGRYAGSIVSALLLATLLGHGSSHAVVFFAITASAAGASALLALRLDGARTRGAAVEGARA